MRITIQTGRYKRGTHPRITVYYGNAVIENGKKKYKPAKFNLRDVFPAEYWDKDKQRVKSSWKDANAINTKISRIIAALEAYRMRCELETQELTAEGLKEAVETVVAPPPQASEYFADIIFEMIEKSESGERLSEKGTQISENSIRKYRNALLHLENFEERHGAVTLKMLSAEFGKTLHVYFNKANLAHNTKASIMRQLITAYNYAVQKGYIEQGDFQKARVEDETADAIALTVEEIDTFFKLDLTDNAELEEVRDIFIVGVWTLLRFGDYSNLHSYQIKEKHIELFAKKTSNRVIVPLHWQAEEILNKYHGQLPNSPTNQTFNKKLKKLAQLAGLKQIEEIKKNVGGKVRIQRIERWKLVTTHTARRTGATRLYWLKVPKKAIMLLTDHKKEENFNKYIKISRLEAIETVSTLEEFQKPLAPQAQEYEAGYYWIKHKSKTHIARIENGLVEFFGNRAKLQLETIFDQGATVLKKIPKP